MKTKEIKCCTQWLKLFKDLQQQFCTELIEKYLRQWLSQPSCRKLQPEKENSGQGHVENESIYVFTKIFGGDPGEFNLNCFGNKVKEEISNQLESDSMIHKD